MLWVFRGGAGFVWWDFLEVTYHCPVIRVLLQEMGDLRQRDSYHISSPFPLQVGF